MKLVIRNFWLIFLCCSTAFAAETIGNVTAVEGKATAQLGQQSPRTLAANAPIYEGDAVVVDTNARIQLALIDGSLINLIENTEYHFDRYRYGEGASGNVSTSTLVKGGFRAFAGKISNESPDSYQIKTNAATIGIRGTVVDACYAEGELDCGIVEGEATVSNTHGAVTIKTKQYAVAHSNTIPVQVASIPRLLARQNFNAPKGVRTSPHSIRRH